MGMGSSAAPIDVSGSGGTMGVTERVTEFSSFGASVGASVHSSIQEFTSFGADMSVDGERHRGSDRGSDRDRVNERDRGDRDRDRGSRGSPKQVPTPSEGPGSLMHSRAGGGSYKGSKYAYAQRSTGSNMSANVSTNVSATASSNVSNGHNMSGVPVVAADRASSRVSSAFKPPSGVSAGAAGA